MDHHASARPRLRSSTARYGASSTFPILGRNGEQIRSVDDWFRYAPPRMGSQHWKDGRSAKELAKAWLKTGVPRMPDELDALLRSHPAATGFVVETAMPEMITHLDNFRGGSRNHDLVLLGRSGEQRVLVSVEAKADESFGKLICEELAAAKPSSRVPDRIDLLSRAVFGQPIDQELGNLRYQLLHGIAGALIEAVSQEAGLVAFVVHEFISSQTDPVKVARNEADLGRFICSFPGMSGVRVRPGRLVEGVTVPGGQYVPCKIPVLVGCVTSLLGW
jgi:hypothetical protein